MALNTEMIITLQQLNGVGNKTIFNIANQVETTITTLSELYNFWRTLKGKKYETIKAKDMENANIAARKIIERSEKEGLGIISYYDSQYPVILKSCTDEKGKLDPPIILYYRGNIKALEMPGIAIIGTREPTSNGEKAGNFFAAEFAKRRYNIVSGLAIGCDTAAHVGALNVNGITTAFLANGLDWSSIYPKENLDLAKKIVSQNGLLLSEYAIGQSCGRYGLVARDRLQAGLSYATIVVQTGAVGGTMHAVNATKASSKPLFVVDYDSDSFDAQHEKTQGNKLLIRNGAHSLRSKEIEKAFSILQLCHSPKQGRNIQQTFLFDDL